MEYLNAIKISESGLDFQKLRLEIIAMNIANANTIRSSDGTSYQPMEAVAHAHNHNMTAGSFRKMVSSEFVGIEEVSIVERQGEPRSVYDPSHPEADEDGFIQMSNVDMSNAMVDMIVATRAYEANLKVMAAAKAMALRALELGE